MAVFIQHSAMLASTSKAGDFRNMRTFANFCNKQIDDSINFIFYQEYHIFNNSFLSYFCVHFELATLHILFVNVVIINA